MSTLHYLLSYSVKPQTGYDAEKADKVRNKIGRITESGWNKLENVETTFKGSFFTIEISEEQKKKKAVKFVEEQFLPILKEFDAGKYDVKIECAMMISEVEQSFVFTVHAP